MEGEGDRRRGMEIEMEICFFEAQFAREVGKQF